MLVFQKKSQSRANDELQVPHPSVGMPFRLAVPGEVLGWPVVIGCLGFER